VRRAAQLVSWPLTALLFHCIRGVCLLNCPGQFGRFDGGVMGCGSSKGAGPEGDMPREGESKEAATGPTHPWSNLPPANNIRSPTARRPANHKTSFAQLVGERKSEISARPASKENDADETALVEELDLVIRPSSLIIALNLIKWFARISSIENASY